MGPSPALLSSERIRCPVCNRLEFDVFRHTNDQHPEFYWTPEDIDKLRSPSPSLLETKKLYLPTPVTKTKKLYTPSPLIKKRPESSCPVCGCYPTLLYRHAKTSHVGHHWTPEQAEAIGAHACGCGTLLRNRKQAVAVHRGHTGCDCSMPGSASQSSTGTEEVAAPVKKRKTSVAITKPETMPKFRTLFPSTEPEIECQSGKVDLNAMIQELERAYPEMSAGHNAQHFWAEGIAEYEHFLYLMRMVPEPCRTSYYPATPIEMIWRTHSSNRSLLTQNSAPVIGYEPDVPAQDKSKRYRRLYEELLSNWHRKISFWWPTPETLNPELSTGKVSTQPVADPGCSLIKVTVSLLDGTRALVPVFPTRTLRFILTALSLQGTMQLEDAVCISVKGQRIDNSQFDLPVSRLGLQNQDEITLLPLIRFAQ